MNPPLPFSSPTLQNVSSLSHVFTYPRTILYRNAQTPFRSSSLTPLPTALTEPLTSAPSQQFTDQSEIYSTLSKREGQGVVGHNSRIFKITVLTEVKN